MKYEVESAAAKVTRTRKEQGLPAAAPASSLRALADHIKAVRAAQARKEAQVA